MGRFAKTFNNQVRKIISRQFHRFPDEKIGIYENSDPNLSKFLKQFGKSVSSFCLDG